MIERCKAAKFDAIALTVDTIVSGNRERCLRSGFTSPPRFTPASVLSYATHPGWVANYLFREKFALPNLQTHVDAEGTNVALSVADYFNTMLDTSMDWKMAETVRADWGGQFCLKGIMSVEDAKRAVDIGATAIYGFEPRRAATRRITLALRPDCRNRRRCRRQDRHHLRRRRPARQPCS